jgi:hypothetical protein
VRGGCRSPYLPLSGILIEMADAFFSSLWRIRLTDWPDVEAVLRRALSRDPSDRYHSVGEFTAALRSAQVPEPMNSERRTAPKLSSDDGLLTDYVRRLNPDGQLFDTGTPEPAAT